MKDLRIVYMGTPEFAIPSLRILVENKFSVVAVITSLDKPRGRGRKLTPSPVKKFAVENNIPVLQPKNLKSPEFIEELKSYNANLQVVVAFRMLPEVVWSMPEYGTVNLHASLLPNYRGAAPINWALINGEKKTGLTTFFIKQEIDTGNVILRKEEEIYPDDDAGSLHDRLMESGAELVLETVKLIQSGDFTIKEQSDEPDLKLAPKLTRETCQIDWTKSNEEIINFVRGLSPYPGAWTEINGKFFKIFRVSHVEEGNEKNPGEFKTDQKHFLHIQTGNGLVNIEELQPGGKNRMKTDEYLRGNVI